MTARPKSKTSNEPQIEKFRAAAREAETDDREEAFDEKLKRISVANESIKESSGKQTPPTHKDVG